jgi:hypothetical protein
MSWGKISSKSICLAIIFLEVIMDNNWDLLLGCHFHIHSAMCSLKGYIFQNQTL